MLQYLSGRRSTPSNPARSPLLELLLVVVVTGILAAMAWPMLLNQSAKAREAKALNLIGAMNRAQNYFYMSNNRFANSLEELGFTNAKLENSFHTYTIEVVQEEVSLTKIVASPLDPSLKGYTGLVYHAGNEQLTSQVCEGETNQAPDPLVANVAGQVEVSGCNDV
jgi:type IV pilus assembly protein PilA